MIEKLKMTTNTKQRIEELEKELKTFPNYREHEIRKMLKSNICLKYIKLKDELKTIAKIRLEAVNEMIEFLNKFK